MSMFKGLVVIFVLALAAGPMHAAPAVGEPPPDWLGKTLKRQKATKGQKGRR